MVAHATHVVSWYYENIGGDDRKRTNAPSPGEKAHMGHHASVQFKSDGCFYCNKDMLYLPPMRRDNRFSGTLRAVYVRWPFYALTYSGVILTLVILGLSVERGWIGLVPLSLATLIVLVYFLLASLWGVFNLDHLQPHHVLFDMGQIRATDTFIYVDLGWRRRALDVAGRLTTGKAIVIDVYNPQWMTSRALVRARARIPAPPPDPRLVWQTGSINLLPQPDNSVTAVILCQVASELWQEGDRQRLFQEIYRVLSENGRLLLAERVRTRTNWLLMGPGALTLSLVETWRDALHAAGFHVRHEKDLQGMIHCFRADKPTYSEARQLTLSFNQK